MTRSAIHFRDHVHPIAKGKSRDSVEEVCRLILEEVAKIPTATTSTIVLFANKQFLSNFLFYHGCYYVSIGV